MANYSSSSLNRSKLKVSPDNECKPPPVYERSVSQPALFSSRPKRSHKKKFASVTPI